MGRPGKQVLKIYRGGQVYIVMRHRDILRRVQAIERGELHTGTC